MKRVFQFFLLGAFLSIQTVNATDYYFSSINGDDGNSGTSSGAPKETESALQTRLNNLSAGDNVYLERGSVWYNIDLSVSSKNGSSGSPITITSYGTGDLPKLISMKQLGTFTDEGSNIWSITDAQLPSNYMNQFNYVNSEYPAYYNDLNFLIIDGEPYTMGRYPNGNNYLSFESVNADKTTSATDNQATQAADYWNGAHMKVGVVDWVTDDVRINDFGGGTYTFNTGDWSPLGDKLNNHNGTFRWIKYFMTNHRTTLDLDGEWSYDNANQKIEVYWSGNLNSSSVYQAYATYCLSLSGCSYFNISDIEFQGATMHTVKMASCSNIDITGCSFKYTPRMALWLDYCTDVTVSENNFDHGISLGVFNVLGRNVVIEDNSFNQIGCFSSMGTDRDFNNFQAILDDRRRGITSIQRNSIDSTGYSGIGVIGIYQEAATPTAPAHLLIDDNDISNYCLIHTDGGGVYVFQDRYSPANTIKRISGNIVKDGFSNYGYFASNTALTMGLYVDGKCDGVEISDNTVWGTGNGLNMHGTENTTIRDNKVYKAGDTHNWDSGFVGDGSGYGHDTYPDINANIKENQIVMTGNSVGGNWFYTTFNSNGSVCDSNYYYHPNSADDLIMKKTVSWSGTRISFSEWKSITSFDTNSTYNKNGETYSAGLGISEDEFVKLLVNRDQSSSRVVSLHGCTFEDVDGNTISGSVTIPSRSSKFLFYKSGNADSLALVVEDPDYVPSVPNTYTLSISYSGTGTGSVSPGSGAYAMDTTLSLTATADIGSVFAGWSGDTTTTSNPLSLPMWKNRSITATFTDTTSTPTSDTIAFWRFENNANDETGVHDATLYGSPTYYSPGAEGSYGLNLDGTGRYVNCDTITLGDSFSISGYYLIWGTSGTRALFGTTTSSSPDGILATVNLSTGVFSLITGDGSSSATATSTTGNHSSGSWVKFEYIVDKSSNTCTIKVNDSDESSSTTIDGDFTDGKTFYIGQDSGGGTRIWGRVDGYLIVGEGGGSGTPDATVTIIATDATATEASETTGTIRISRGSETSGNLTVNFTTGGTATLNTDYTLSSTSSVTITDGNTYTDITVTPDDDSSDESDETVILTLSSGSGYTIGSPSSATVTIIDDDVTVTISATDATATEASETTGTIRVSRGSETSGNLTVNFTTGGTATLNTDYTLSSTSNVTITNGNTYADITVTPDDDVVAESDETVILTLSSGSGYTIGTPSSATVTIQDNDESEQDTIGRINFTFSSYYDVSGWSNVYTASTFNINLGDGVYFSTNETLAAGVNGEPSTVLPANAGSTYHYIGSADNTAKYYNVSGLDTSHTYSFSFFESRDDASASGDRTTTYSIGGQSAGVNPVGNTSSFATLTNVEADASGEVDITVTKISGQYGYINALYIIDEGLKRAKIRSDKLVANNLDAITYYPVPVENHLNLKNVPAESMITVYDLVGNKIYQVKSGLGADLQLDMSRFKSGIYLIKIANEGLSKVNTLKVVKR